MSERKTAAAALEITPDIEQFIQAGVPKPEPARTSQALPSASHNNAAKTETDRDLIIHTTDATARDIPNANLKEHITTQQSTSSEPEPASTRSGNIAVMPPQRKSRKQEQGRRVKKRPATTPKEPTQQVLPLPHVKARVQKTVRFRPELIARFEEHLRIQEQTGTALTFQNAMNEALEAWLASEAV